MPNAKYDEELVVSMLATGNGYRAVSEAAGISESMVGKIARGDYRPDLYQRIRSHLVQQQRAMRHLQFACAPALMQVHIREGLEGKTETARKCREYILDRVSRDNPLLQPSEADIVNIMDGERYDRRGILAMLNREARAEKPALPDPNSPEEDASKDT